jgi:phospholipid/cholesterol/gamma-HCH transport system substrate-binding protein
MNRSRLELKVGLFVFVCLLLLAGLIIEFSRGPTLLRSTYNLHLRAHNAGGLRPSAAVLLSGVQVGTVSQITLAPSGTNVDITLRMFSEYVVRDDARFVIEQSGFLGDQYVAIYPERNEGKPLVPGTNAVVEEPFNLQEVARSAAGFIKHIDQAATNLNDAINDVRQQVLNQQTLTNFAYTVETLQRITSDAASAVEGFNSLVASNGSVVSVAVSNFAGFSVQLDDFARSAQGILDSNRPQIAATFSNLQVSTAQLTNLMAQIQSGDGLAGEVLRNRQLAGNVANLASNLDIAAGNLRSNGLWHFLWTPKDAKPDAKKK